MKVTELQNEINHLLFLYFTSIGVIQRDADTDDIQQKIDELVREMYECKKRIMDYIEVEDVETELYTDYVDIVTKGKKFISDGFFFLDKVLD